MQRQMYHNKFLIVHLFMMVILFFSIQLEAAIVTPFKIRVKTDNPGASSSIQFTIPTNSSEYTYDYSVDCNNDGTPEVTHQHGDYTCEYAGTGYYTVSISGTFPQIYFNSSGDKEKLIAVQQWGSSAWSSMKGAFSGCSNMNVTAADKPNLSNVTSMKFMFNRCSSFNAYIGDWDVSNVIDMTGVFCFTDIFNQDLGSWDVSNALTMFQMFCGAASFNQDIGDWDVSKVADMDEMFYHADNFNQDIGNWNVSNVHNMIAMFAYAGEFDQDIGNWNIANVHNMTGMFANASLSISHYDSLLMNWAELPLQNDVIFDAGSSDYCEGDDALDKILIDYNWTITDGVRACSFYIDSPTTMHVNRGELVVGTITEKWRSANNFSIVGGADQDKFNLILYAPGLVIEGAILSFKTLPTPGSDANGDNIYRVQIKATGSGDEEDIQTINVKVDNAFLPAVYYLMLD